MDYQDANGQVLTASQTIALYPSAIQLGIKTDGWLMKQDDLRLNVVALDNDGKPVKGKRVSIALYSRQILTARRRLIGGFYAYDNQMRTKKLGAHCSQTTDAQGLANCKIDPGISGEIYAVATTTDDNGQRRARDDLAMARGQGRLVVRRRQWRPHGRHPGDRPNIRPATSRASRFVCRSDRRPHSSPSNARASSRASSRISRARTRWSR